MRLAIGFKQLRSLFIKTASTPNPSFLKFIPGKPVLEEGTLDIPALRYASVSPLARNLFQIEGVQRVFYAKDYISVGKTEGADWTVLKPQVFAMIMDHYTSGNPLVTDTPPAEDTKVLPTDSEAVAVIKEILEGRVRPFVQEDGGDIRYDGFDEATGTVTLEMRGSCAGCPSSSITLKNGIEKMLKHYVPEVKNVESVDYEDKS